MKKEKNFCWHCGAEIDPNRADHILDDPNFCDVICQGLFDMENSEEGEHEIHNSPQ